MDAKEFVRELVRMCKSKDDNCDDCPIRQSMGCPLFVPENADAYMLVAAVEKWSKENPLVTNGMKVMEMVGEQIAAKADVEQYIVLNIEKDWWNAEYEEGE
jgi:hypothetical protein